MSTLSWAFNFVPWWLYPAIAVVLLVVFWQPVIGLWSILPRGVKTLILAFGALFTAYAAGRNRGSKDERDLRAKANANAVKNRKDIDDAVGNKSRSDVDRDLGKWLRD